MKNLLTLILLLTTLILFSCKKENNDIQPITQTTYILNKADFRITDEKWDTTSSDELRVIVTVKNIGNGIGYALRVKYKLKKENIIFEGTAYPGDMNDILPDENKTDSVIFYNTPTNMNLKYKSSVIWLNR